MGLRVYAAAAALVPVALPAAYLLYLHLSSSRECRLADGRLRSTLKSPTVTQDPGAAPDAQPSPPTSLPDAVRDHLDTWVVSYERAVSAPLDLSTLALTPADASQTDTRPSALLRCYVQAAHVAFSWTPQAFLIRSLIKDKDTRATFDASRLLSTNFVQGDIVNGVYRVIAYQGKGPQHPGQPERVELALTSPPDYKGPPMEGRIIAIVEEAEEKGSVVLVNETWMWRKVEDKPTMLESAGGKLFHGLLAKWLLTAGKQAVEKKFTKKNE
ncbi:hypothetical protein VHEMI05542 [[Torrubiella] hemipterigena]|uniref:Uncharacterized protein n=1 Tax=[Torrubiella] hemipterigena TaxID=1531966 RepID=A0A0A1THC9_9HYPO|nr:hypothetical protein VHEMI05542 [[Torrubiella] hemipterigena]